MTFELLECNFTRECWRTIRRGFLRWFLWIIWTNLKNRYYCVSNKTTVSCLLTWKTLWWTTRFPEDFTTRTEPSLSTVTTDFSNISRWRSTKNTEILVNIYRDCKNMVCSWYPLLHWNIISLVKLISLRDCVLSLCSGC